MPTLASLSGSLGYGRRQPPAPSGGAGGSMLFDGTTNGYLTIPNDADFRFGTGDFTIEWFQYMQSGQSFPRVFSMGTYPSSTIGVSIEGSSFYMWVGGGANLIGSVSPFNSWIHYAISRSGSTVRVFQNGTLLGSFTSSYNFADSTNVPTIGNETSRSSGAAFKGNITNFHWVKGTALYTANFTRPAAPLSPVANTKMLLLASTSGTTSADSSAAPKTVTAGSGISWSSSNPF